MTDIEAIETGWSEAFVRKSIKEIITEVKSAHVSKQEFILPGDLTAEDLQLLLELPIEVGIMDHKGQFILTPNPDNPRVLMIEGYQEREWNSKVLLHTHYKMPGLVIDTPSFQDIIKTPEIKPNQLAVVVHPNGITQYSRPVKNPLTGEDLLSPDDFPTMFSQYQEAMGMTFSPRYQRKDKPFINDKYTLPERVKLAKEFVQKSGMLVAEAKWHDTQGIQKMMGTINSRRK